MSEVLDLAGKPVQVGDTIAAAFRNSTHAFLRIGSVQSFGERDNKLTIRVAWESQSGYNGPHPVRVVGSIEAGLYRFVKLGA